MAAQGQIVDILKASKEQLETLSNIGPAKAKQIIEFCEKHAITEENLSKVEPQLEILLKKGLICVGELTIADLLGAIKVMQNTVKQLSDNLKAHQETTEHRFQRISTEINEGNSLVQETTLQTDRKLQELDQSINLRIDHATSQRRGEAFINAQYDKAFPHNGTQLQGATYLEQGARPRTNTFNENPSQNVIHPGNADYTRDTRMMNESEDRQENHNIGRSTNGTNERNHTDDADQSVFRGQVSYMLPKLPTYDRKST